jgi:hypothetical protein
VEDAPGVSRGLAPRAIPPCRPRSEGRTCDAHSEHEGGHLRSLSVAFTRHVVYTLLSDFKWSQALLVSGAVAYNTLLSPEPSEDLG